MFYSNWRFRLVLVSLLLLVISGYFSFVEVSYLFGSRSVRANVTQLSEVTERRRSSTYKHLQEASRTPAQWTFSARMRRPTASAHVWGVTPKSCLLARNGRKTWKNVPRMTFVSNQKESFLM